MKILFSFFLVLSLSFNTWADDLRVPIVPTTLLDGVEHKCYDTEQYRRILLLSSAYQELQEKQEVGLEEAYRELIGEYEKELNRCENSSTRWKIISIAVGILGIGLGVGLGSLTR